MPDLVDQLEAALEANDYHDAATIIEMIIGELS